MSVFGFATHLVRNAVFYSVSDGLSLLVGSIGRVKRRMKEDLDRGVTIRQDFTRDNFVVFSDIHRGNRDSADRFKNESIYYNALSYYNNHNYNLVLLGDIEECWGYKNKMDSLKQENMKLLQMEMNFVNKNKYIRIIGNHDDMWRDSEKVEKYLEVSNGDPGGQPIEITPYLSVVLEHEGKKILLIHGCQGNNFSDIGDKCASEIIRIKFSLRIKSPKDEFAKKRNKLRRQEKKILKWAKDKGMLVIMGHTHVPYFMSLPSTRFEKNSLDLIEEKLKKSKDTRYSKELNQRKKDQTKILESIEKQKTSIKKIEKDITSTLFNSGNCCKDSDEISAIEISGGQIKEVYWKEDSVSPQAVKSEDLSKVFELV